MWKRQPGFHPYYVSGDFNGDGNADFAVVFVRRTKTRPLYLAIFNGPFAVATAASPVSNCET